MSGVNVWLNSRVVSLTIEVAKLSAFRCGGGGVSVFLFGWQERALSLRIGVKQATIIGRQAYESVGSSFPLLFFKQTHRVTTITIITSAPRAPPIIINSI